MKRKLFIDTGHSVKYPGASGFKSEVDWVRAIADKLEPLLDNTYWDVIRVPDTYPNETASITLVRRVGWINANGTSNDVLISIHANSDDNASARGVEVCYMGGRKEDDLAVTVNLRTESLRLAMAYSRATGVPLHNGGTNADVNSRFKDNTGQGRLGMVRDTKPLAFLIECGFVSNKDDMSIDPSLAASGIANYLNSYNHMPNHPNTQPDETTLVLQELNKRQVIHDISNPNRPVTLAEVAFIVYRNDHLPKITQ